MMTQEPKLTGEEVMMLAEIAQRQGAAAFIEAMRERRLIAPEPVDPLLIEAREICGDWAEGERSWVSVNAVKNYREGRWDDASHMDIALAALRRGMELAQRPEPQPAVALTREMVREAADVAAIDYLLRAKDYDHPDAFEFRIKRLHDALTEMMKGEAK
jgi:hypothetical protein